MRRSGRSKNRKDRDRGAEMRLTERTRKLIPETRRVVTSNRLLYSTGFKPGRISPWGISEFQWGIGTTE